LVVLSITICRADPAVLLAPPQLLAARKRISRALIAAYCASLKPGPGGGSLFARVKPPTLPLRLLAIRSNPSTIFALTIIGSIARARSSPTSARNQVCNAVTRAVAAGPNASISR
jgi:hypothetical protein